MKNSDLAIIIALALGLGIGLLHFVYPWVFLFLFSLSLVLSLVFLIFAYPNKRTILFVGILGRLLVGFALSWIIIAFVEPARTPKVLSAKAEQRYRQEIKIEKERLENLSVMAANLDKDLNQAGVTVTLLSNMELVTGRLWVFRGQRSDDRTERIVFYEMSESVVCEKINIPHKGDKLPLMVRTFRATDGWYAPLGQNPLAILYLVKNNCQ